MPNHTPNPHYNVTCTTYNTRTDTNVHDVHLSAHTLRAATLIDQYLEPFETLRSISIASDGRITAHTTSHRTYIFYANGDIPHIHRVLDHNDPIEKEHNQ